MLPYYFGLIRVMRGGWKQQFQQCRDTTSGEEWGLARWAIKLSYIQSEDLCIWQLSGQPLLNPGFVKTRLMYSVLHLLTCEEQARRSRKHGGKATAVGKVLLSWILVTKGREEGPSATKGNYFYLWSWIWSAMVMMLMWIMLGKLMKYHLSLQLWSTWNWALLPQQ